MSNTHMLSCCYTNAGLLQPAKAAMLRSCKRSRLGVMERFLDGVLDSLDSFVAVLAPGGAIMHANRRCFDVSGYSHEDIIGRHLADTPWFSYSRNVESQVRDAVEQAGRGERRKLDVQARLRTGAFLDVELSAAPMRDKAGRITHVVASAIDISERIRTAATLSDREERLRFALEAAGAGAFAMDFDSGTITWSENNYKIFGLDPIQDPLPYEAWLSRIVHPDDRARVHAHMTEAFRSGSSEFAFEFRVIRPKNEVRWLACRGRIVRDAEGSLSRMSGLNIDITEKKQAERQQELLMREVDHRARNALTAVEAVVRLSANVPSPDPGNFTRIVQSRVLALGKAHALLAEHRWAGVSLSAILFSELGSEMKETRVQVSIHGPPAVLCPDAVQPFYMIMHELAMHARVYGALSTAVGKISITCHSDEHTGAVDIRWQEKGCNYQDPPAREPASKILLANAAQLGGPVHILVEGDVMQAQLTISASMLVSA